MTSALPTIVLTASLPMPTRLLSSVTFSVASPLASAVRLPKSLPWCFARFWCKLRLLIR